MKTTTVGGIVVALIIGAGAWYLFGTKNVSAPVQSALDYKNATYLIEGQPVTLVGGRAEVAAAPGSASKTVTQYFGNEATGDLSGDGVPDTAFLLTQDSGGSGTFFYAVAAIKTPQGDYRGTDAVLLGDRVAPQPTEIRDGKLIVNYADRAAGESFAVQPSVGKTIVLKLDPETLRFGEVAQNFEGETDMSRFIQVSSPTAGQKVTSPLSTSGKAVGGWYFGGSFPIVLMDSNGQTLAESFASTEVDSNTAAFVPFTAKLTFAKPTTTTGTLVLKKDNPSGLSEKDASISIPVSF